MDRGKKTGECSGTNRSESEYVAEGIKTEDILTFTKTMVMLGDTTNLEAAEAASALAKFANITQMRKLYHKRKCL